MKITDRKRTIEHFGKAVRSLFVMIRLNQLMMGFSVGVGCLILGIQNTPKLWHHFQLWQHSGVYCEQATEDGKATHYGIDCR